MSDTSNVKQYTNNKNRIYEGQLNRPSGQLIDPNGRLVRSLVAQRKGPYRYHTGYPLHGQATGTYSVGTLLVEWYHKNDRYVVQASNVPTQDKCGMYCSSWVAYEGLGHTVDPNVSLLLMFEIRQSISEERSIFNCRVRHVPTKALFFDWDNTRTPRFTFIRENQEIEMKEFLGERLTVDGKDGGSSYEGELLPRLEQTTKSWKKSYKHKKKTFS